MEYLYGKLNKQIELAEYKGATTDSIKVYVDNDSKLISAEYIGDGFLSAGNQAASSNYLAFDKNQNLTENNINTIYSNIKLDDYADKKLIIQEKEKQVITGSLLVSGNLSTNSNYITVNGAGGLKVKDPSTGRTAKLTLDSKGNVVYDSGIYTRVVALLNSNLNPGKFLYYDNGILSTQTIYPRSINTSDYNPALNIDLTTKEYVDKRVLNEGPYKRVATLEERDNLTASYGLRVFVEDENKIEMVGA